MVLQFDSPKMIHFCETELSFESKSNLRFAYTTLVIIDLTDVAVLEILGNVNEPVAANVLRPEKTLRIIHLQDTV